MKQVSLAFLVAAGVLVLLVVTFINRREEVPDAFTADSFWNTPLPTDTPVHPRSDEIISFLAADNVLNGCITLAGARNNWGMPIYLADGSDPIYNVTSRKWDVPPEFSTLRIPHGAVAANNSDGEMVVYDLAAGLVAQLSKAEHDLGADTWTVSGGSIAYLTSNGLDGSLPQADDPRNAGSFRGYNGAVAAVQFDDIKNGGLDNVVKIGVNNSHVESVLPMIGSDGRLETDDAPHQGMRLRIRPDLDLGTLGLEPQALLIAKGLQDYGAIVGDSTGAGIVLMLEDMDRSGTGGQWDLSERSLCAISAADLQIVDIGSD